MVEAEESRRQPATLTLSEADQDSLSDVIIEEQEDDDEDEDSDITTDCAVAVAGQERPSFDNVVVSNSTDVHFGNKTFYNGPVTIKQIVYSAENGSVCGVTGSDSGVTQGNGTLKDAGEQSAPQERKSLGPWASKVVGTRRGMVAIASAGLLGFLVIVVTLVTLLPSRQNGDKPVTASHTDDEGSRVSFNFQSTDNTPSGKLRMVVRKEWLAQPPMEPPTPLKHPVPYVVILHTATENCSTQAQCVFFVRQTQTFHIESKGWSDIGYSFLVGGDGNVYEGRGWDSMGAFALGYNDKSIGISFIGTFISEIPPEKQVSAARLLIRRGVELGKIAGHYKLLAHRQLSPTESPGQAFYEYIKTWDHWAEKP